MPFPVRSLRFALAAASIALVAGCGSDDLQPHDLYGRYELDMPAEARAGHSDVIAVPRYEQLSTTMGGDLFATRTITSLELRAGAPVGSTPDSVVVSTSRFRLSVRGDLVYFHPDCPPNALALCVDWLFRGPLEGDRLTLHPRPEMSISTRHYRRVER